jgi:hypothetical protein
MLHDDPACLETLPTVLLFTLQHYITHEEDGSLRERPLDGDLTAVGGLTVAWQFMQWVGHNMPGMTYTGKAPLLVRLKLQCS